MYRLYGADSASVQVESGLQTKPPGSDTVRVKNTERPENQDVRALLCLCVSWVVFRCTQWSGIQLSAMMTESNGITVNADL